MGITYYNNSSLTITRKELRNNSTRCEKILWEELKGSKFMGLKFRRQHSIGRYILDFYCTSKKIGIEIDGIHHFENEVLEYDKIRSEYIESINIKILRFTNYEVEKNINLVLEKLKDAIQKL